MKLGILTLESYLSKLLIKLKRLKFTELPNTYRSKYALNYARKAQTSSKVTYVIPGEPVLHKITCDKSLVTSETSETSDGEGVHSWPAFSGT